MEPIHLGRRAFLKKAGALAALGAIRLPAATRTAIDNTEPMKVTQIDAVTFRKDLHIGGGSGSSEDGAEFWWVRLHTDKGIVGTGETYPFAQGEVGALREHAHLILGRDPRDIDGIWRALHFEGIMRTTGGADMRMLSAVNMAQLDILGQASGLPLYRLLGGKTRPRVRVYNTTTDYWAINDMKMGRDTMKIVRFLLDRGVTGMKIYPFEAPDHYLSNQALEQGLRWIRDIRDGVANQMDICVDCWGNFDFPSALRIAKALEPYNIMYLEDAMISGNAKTYARLAAATTVPVCISETLATRYEYREFFEQKACGVIMYDLTWCGGPSEAKRISDMAETYLIPTSPHTCGGPLLYICSAHLATALPDFLIMESNYWKYAHQYPYFVNNVPAPKEGHVTPPEAPGIGAEIKPEIFRNGDALVETVAKL
ncbi:MAG TPA: mandelate racemase/muconate lactonizing enzyme family protein [Bryobacteraceae bacterium]|nr:mandelate racemase/muconate lactonizing enzyme family protein [Bryobacteraceae bacterium]